MRSRIDWATRGALALAICSLLGCQSILSTGNSEAVIGHQTTLRAANEDTEPTHLAQNAATGLVPSSTDSDREKEHIYIFLINGLDPFHYAGMPDLAAHLRALGYSQVHYSELFAAYECVEKIPLIFQHDTRAKFVLIGYSFGANMARNITHALREQGIMVDLLIYLNANTLRNIPYDQPENARRILNILAWGFLLDGDQLDRAENIELADAWHFNTPTHPRTLQLIQQELSVLQDRQQPVNAE
ncbi:hypothetical protein HRbin36_00471 [bacterium HR36]|nr:hypothetical protein HRbin36_00471 [bacterium HR36]